MKTTRDAILLLSVLALSLSADADETNLTFEGVNAVALNELWSEVLVHATPDLYRNSLSGSQHTFHAILKGKPHSRAVLLLENVLQNQQLIDQQKPAARLLLQRAAWAAFDRLADVFLIEQLRPPEFTRPKTPLWAVGTASENKKLRHLLARLIKRVALTKEEIDRLPNNYTTKPISDAGESILLPNQIELPSDLFDEDGTWLQVVYWANKRIGVTHEATRRLRSETLLFLRLPGGRDAGLKFIESHNKHARAVSYPLLPDVGVAATEPSEPAPQIPSGTQLLLLNRMLAVVPSGQLVSTPLIESIEINDATSVVNPKSGATVPMKNAAFHLSYQHLIDTPSETTLRRRNAAEPMMGADFVPGGLGQCVQCHSSATTVLSFDRSGKSAHADRPIDLRLKVVPNGKSPPTVYVKSNTLGHGLLQGIMEAADELGRDSR